MELDITQLIVWATKRTFSAMLDWGVVHLEDADPNSLGTGVLGVIGLSGEVSGSLVLIMPENLAVSATEGLLGEQVQSVNGDVIDTVGELTNIIAGGAKSRIDSQVNLSLPTVVTGGNQNVGYDSQNTAKMVHFMWGNQEFGVKYCIDGPPRLGIVSPKAALAL